MEVFGASTCKVLPPEEVTVTTPVEVLDILKGIPVASVLTTGSCTVWVVVPDMFVSYGLLTVSVVVPEALVIVCHPGRRLLPDRFLLASQEGMLEAEGVELIPLIRVEIALKFEFICADAMVVEEEKLYGMVKVDID